MSVLTDQVRASFKFTVDKRRLVGPSGESTDHFGLFRSDNNVCVGSAVKRNYREHTVDDVCALVEAGSAAFGDNDVKVTCGWKEGHIVTVQPSDDYRRSIFGTKDNVFPRIIIRAMYDSQPFEGSLGIFADKCKNLHIVHAAGGAVHARIRHSNHLYARIGELRDKFYELASNWDNAVDTIRAMESRELNVATYLREVFPQPDAALATSRANTLYFDRMQKIVSRIARERLAVGRFGKALDKATAWELYSGVQGYIQHDSTRHGKPNNFERAVMALDSKTVAKALELALAS